MERRPTILTVDEVARYLRVHSMTVYRLIQRGELPALRVGRSWRFKKDQLSQWLQEREINAHRDGARPTSARPSRRLKPRGRR